MIKFLEDIIENAGVVILFINIIVFLITFKFHRKKKTYVIFTVYLIVTFVIQAWSFYLAYDGGRDNLFLSHYYFVLQFILLSFFYESLFVKHQKKYVFTTLIIILIILTIRYVNEPSRYFKFDLVEIFICSLPLVIYSIVYLYNSLNMSKGYFYINAGILIYLSASTLIFILGNYLSTQDINTGIREIWMINDVLYLLFLMLIFIEWFKNYRPIKAR